MVASQVLESDDPRIGTVLQDRYRVTSRLSAGGMGAVYRGERLQLGRSVAIKFLHAAFLREEQFLRRFENEARAMSRLSHPHCVSVIDFGVADVPYVVMEYVAGTTLKDVIEKGRIAPARAILIIHQVLAGLAHAHNQGVIHRDIKPANIMLTEATGTGDHVRILDFGLAKLTSGSGTSTATAPMAIGTPAYMPPEQARGEQVDARSDVYAVGILLFELLTGEKPFQAEEAFAIIQKQISEPAPKLRDKAPDLPWSDELEALVARALAKKPAARFANAGEMADALAAVPESESLFNKRLPSVLAPPGRAETPIPRKPTARVGTDQIEHEANAPSDGDGRRIAVWIAILLISVGASAGLYLREHRPKEPSSAGARPAAPVAPVAVKHGPPDAGPAALTAAADRLAADRAPEAGSLAALMPQGADASAGDEADDEEDEAPPEAVDPPEPPEPAPTPSPPRTVRDVEKLIKDGQKDAAYRALIVLRKQNPKNPYVAYLLGNLQFEKLYYSDGLASYEVAITGDADYKKSVTLVRNAIRALGPDKSAKKAEALLIKVGRPALPQLDRAAKTSKSKAVRGRAAWVAQRVRKKR
jgi:serine/threonine-protein kinase